MNLDEAIDVHAGWKRRLEAYLAKHERSLDPEVIGRNDECDLGKWLEGEDAAVKALPAHVHLVTAHTAFHKAAAHVVREANAGLPIRATVALGSGSAYAQSSSAVIKAIMMMRSELRRGKH